MLQPCASNRHSSEEILRNGWLRDAATEQRLNLAYDLYDQSQRDGLIVCESDTAELEKTLVNVQIDEKPAKRRRLN
jgi:hypothetical protein